jgi:DNA repair protein RAD50
VFIDLDTEKEKIIEARMDLVRRYSEAKGTYNSKKEAYLKAKNDL